MDFGDGALGFGDGAFGDRNLAAFGDVVDSVEDFGDFRDFGDADWVDLTEFFSRAALVLDFVAGPPLVTSFFLVAPDGAVIAAFVFGPGALAFN